MVMSAAEEMEYSGLAALAGRLQVVIKQLEKQLTEALERVAELETEPPND